MSHSKRDNIVIYRQPRPGGSLPAFGDLAVRHFEKSPPLAVDGNKRFGFEPNTVEFVCPVDFLRMTVPLSLTDEVIAVRIGFRR